jgi:SanA protein
MKSKIQNLVFFILVILVGAWIINEYILVKTENKMVYANMVLPAVQAIVVPGASVYRSGKLSPALAQRMQAGVLCKQKNPRVPLLLSGHSVPNGYSETQAMVEYAKSQGIPQSEIIEDGHGRSTYVTLLNCKQKFHLQKVLIVSQSFYLPRALYIAESLGLEAFGLVVEDSAKQETFHGREVLSRIKDFFFLKITRLFRAR